MRLVDRYQQTCNSKQKKTTAKRMIQETNEEEDRVYTNELPTTILNTNRWFVCDRKFQRTTTSMIYVKPLNKHHKNHHHHHRHRRTSRRVDNMLNKTVLQQSGTILATVVASFALFTVLWPVLAFGQIDSQLAEQISTSSNHLQHQEILVQPHSQVRIECKLPQTTPSKSRSYLWNFDRTVGVGSAKQNVLCFESKCVDEPTFGYQLEMDRETGAYDLIFSNVTYELNDGLYYCKYKDTNPESKQILNREFRLTVLSK